MWCAKMTAAFILNSILFGVGLAMDAFSVSVVNGIADPKMRLRKVMLIAGVFAFFQALNPLLGYLAVHTVVEYFSAISRFLPLVSFLLLSYIGVHMVYSGARCMRCKNCGNLDMCKDKPCLSDETGNLTFKTLIIQGIATSIDALSVGFTIADYTMVQASVCAAIIAAVTLIICLIGLKAGNRIGRLFADRAQIAGGIVLILIGIEILVKGIIA